MADTGAMVLLRTRRSIAAALGLLIITVAAGCSASADSSDESTASVEPQDDQGSSAVESSQDQGAAAVDDEADAPWMFDASTAVFPANIDVEGSGSFTSTHSPSSNEVALVVAAIATDDELSWAREHPRFIYGADVEGRTALVAIFDCNAQLADTADLLELMQLAYSVDGGGDCNGFASFEVDGELIEAAPNGPF